MRRRLAEGGASLSWIALPLLLLLLLGAEPVKPECEASSDCVLAFDCDCSCCKVSKAVTKKQRQSMRLRCGRMGACSREKCAEETCVDEPEGAFQTVCTAGRCVKEAAPAKPKPPSRPVTPG